MILRQFLHADPVGISYLFGCGGKAVGAAGAEYVLSANADVSFPFKRVLDGDVLPLATSP